MTTSSSSVVGGWRSPRDAEHDFRDAVALLGHRVAVASTHVVPGREPGSRQIAVHASDRTDDLSEGARAFVYPGVDGLRGRMRVCDLLGRSAIDAVEGLAGTEVGADAAIDTLDFVRPVLRDGRLVLQVAPAADATGPYLVPAEVPNPTPCCAEH